MTLLSRFRSWLRAIVRRSRMESEMDTELRFHIEAFAEDLVRSGVSRREAQRRARMEFGGFERAKEECRDARGVNWIQEPDSGFALWPPHAPQVTRLHHSCRSDPGSGNWGEYRHLQPH